MTVRPSEVEVTLMVTPSFSSQNFAAISSITPAVSGLVIKSSSSTDVPVLPVPPLSVEAAEASPPAWEPVSDCEHPAAPSMAKAIKTAANLLSFIRKNPLALTSPLPASLPGISAGAVLMFEVSLLYREEGQNNIAEFHIFL